MNCRKIGTQYEKKAVDFLMQQDYQILETNFSSRHGEIDIIAKENSCLVFVEVKYRKDGHAGLPEEAVTHGKQYRIIQSARYYLYQNHYPSDTPCRFDVIAICGTRLHHWKNAFDTTC